MSVISQLLKEMDQEAQTTRKMLERVPVAYFTWRPHQKSMTIKQLSTHIAELPGWVTMAVTTDELDFANTTHNEPEINNTAELLAYFEESFARGMAALENATLEQLDELWTMRNGDQVYFTNFKAEVIRASFCQITHHRAQLGVYLRLLDIPIPGSYGPSADEMEMQMEQAEA